MPLKMGQLTCLQTLQYFNVGLEKGRRIDELGCLKNLRGELSINGLQSVCNREEARTACLHEKHNIYKLTYRWSHHKSQGREINDENVLDGLQPHQNLKSFAVGDYLGIRFPTWFSEEMLPNLVTLILTGWEKCEEIPALGQLKFLQHLKLDGFHKVKCIGPTFYGAEVNNNGSRSNTVNIQVFPSLKELELGYMPMLVEWKEEELRPIKNGGRGVGVRMFPGLEKLTIRKCPLLKSTPNQFEVLCELSIRGIDSEMSLLNLCSSLTSLIKLDVDSVKELTCLPDEMLRNNIFLQRLSVSNCRDFCELPQSLYNLHSLKILSIDRCPNFSYIPVPCGEEYLTSLLTFQLSHCDGLISVPSGLLDHCRSLESLRVYNCNNLVSFALNFQEMPSLSRMIIIGCPKLNSVPTGGLHSLTRLEELRISAFSESVDFQEIQLMFSGSQQLSSLRSLMLPGRSQWDSLPYQFMQLSALSDLQICKFGIKSLDFLDAMPNLRDLKIWDCPSLEVLYDGLVNLVSLRTLYLLNCKKLHRLPSRNAMRRLTKLSFLKIKGCPELTESLTNRSDPNSQWSKISHIKEIKIDGTRIQNLFTSRS